MGERLPTETFLRIGDRLGPVRLTPPILGGKNGPVKQYRTTDPEEYHVAESDRRPGESERAWMRRVAEQGRRAEQRRKDTERQTSLDRQAEEAEIRETLGDEVWLHQATTELFHLTPDQLQNRLDRAQKKNSWKQRDQEILDALKKEQKPRFLEGKKARNRRVGKFLKKNKGQIDRAQKKGRGWFS